jgi:eukaryotic-like serine/threonine-protein kinase
MSTAVDRPRVVGRYALYGEVASGGMATVHYGRLLGPVGFTRTVAIKKLHPHFAKDAEFVAMFLDEARLAARIHHPNVVQTLDVVAADGELFLVMDYVHGEPLSRLRRLASDKGEAIPLRVGASILCGALHGLHAAHEATSDRGEPLDIVHRDVSPQNVLIGLDGIARVLDFGVAKAIGRAHATRDGKLKGKLAYMAPEQLEGHATRQTDVFAASVVLWETLTGERLFDAVDDRAVIGKVLGKEIEAPSKRMTLREGALGGATRGQLDALDAVTLRGLSRRPEDRWDTARAMAVALERCLGIASPTEVGEWLEHVAGEHLRQRSERVAEIESHSTSPAHLSSPPPATDRSLVSSPSAEPLVHTQVSSPTVSGATSPSRPTRLRSRGWTVAAGLAVTLLVLLAASRALVPNARQTTPPASTLDSVDGTASAEPTSIPSTPLASPTPTTVAGPLPAADAGRAPRSLGPRRPPAHKPGCDPPYTLDSAGHQRFKEECFR